MTSAPLVVGDLVIFQIGGEPDACLVALDVKTGEERWRALDRKASCSAPRLVNRGGREVVLAWTAHWLASLEPATGKAWWKIPYKPKNCAFPSRRITDVGLADALLGQSCSQNVRSRLSVFARIALNRQTSCRSQLFRFSPF